MPNRIEKALRESEAQFRFLTDTMADIIWTIDMNLRTTYVSPSIEKVLGFTVAERKKQTLEEMVTPQSLKAIQALLAKEIKKEKTSPETDRTITIESQYYKKDGSTIWLENKVKWIRNPNGTITGINGVSRDISERKRAEKALRESEERYRAVVEDTPGLICCYLPNGEITFVNKTYCEYYAKSHDELIGSNFMSSISDQDRKAVIAGMSTMTVTSPIQSFEYRIDSPGGEICWQKWTNRAMFDPEGKIISYQAIGEDITYRKRVESERKQLSAAIEQTSENVIITDAEGTIQYVNPAFKRLTGYSRSEVIGQNP